LSCSIPKKGNVVVIQQPLSEMYGLPATMHGRVFGSATSAAGSATALPGDFRPGKSIWMTIMSRIGKRRPTSVALQAPTTAHDHVSGERPIDVAVG